MLLFWKSHPKCTLIHLRKNGERLPHSSMHNSSRNSATIIRKFRDQGSKFSYETQRFACVLCYYFGSPILNVPLSIYGKTEKDFLIVACIIAAETRLLLLGNFETKARNLAKRPKVYWRPILLSQEVFRSQR